MSPKNDLPYFAVFANERLADPALRMAGDSAVGIFHFLEPLAWISDEPGVLVWRGQPMKSEMIAKQIGRDPAAVNAAIAELVECGALGRRRDGALFVPQMAAKAARARSLSATRSAAGRLGAVARWQNYGKPDGKNGKRMANPTGADDGNPMANGEDVFECECEYTPPNYDELKEQLDADSERIRQLESEIAAGPNHNPNDEDQ